MKKKEKEKDDCVYYCKKEIIDDLNCRVERRINLLLSFSSLSISNIFMNK